MIKSRGHGKGLGFPTANLNPHHETLPPAGVYAAWGSLDKKILKGVIHIGERPTFADKERSLEVHFLNFHKNIYGREVELVFVRRLRGIQKFSSPQALVNAIKKDARTAARLLKRPI
jgi:riboflavin kinase/FMN adenylyltransferase